MMKDIFKKLTVTQLVKQPDFFIGPEGSLPYLQKPAIGPYPEPAEPSSFHRFLIPKVHLNVMFPHKPRSSQWSLTFGPANQNPINTFSLHHAFHMSRPPHLDLITLTIFNEYNTGYELHHLTKNNHKQ
jgi:hypothetical protein